MEFQGPWHHRGGLSEGRMADVDATVNDDQEEAYVR